MYPQSILLVPSFARRESGNCRFSYAETWELVNLFVGTNNFSYHICYENIGRKQQSTYFEVKRQTDHGPTESINQSVNQSINQSINVFQGKIQTVQFTNIYKHILFLHDIHMILAIMKTNYLLSRLF